jgi:hypothetical protein
VVVGTARRHGRDHDHPLPPPAYLAGETRRGATVYRWFGSRIGLVGEVVVGELHAEVRAGTWRPAIETAGLAYAIVRLHEAFVYNDAVAGIRGDVDRLGEVEAALLGLAPHAPPIAASARSERRSRTWPA